jgi:hypothetical protein
MAEQRQACRIGISRGPLAGTNPTIRAMRPLIVILLYSILANAQDNVADVLFANSNSVNYEQLSPCRLSEIKQFKRFLDEPIESWHSSCYSDSPLEGVDSTLTQFRLVDFSGDGVKDLIYTSYCSSETQFNFLWLRDGDSLKFVGSYVGTVKYLFRSNVLEPYSLVMVTGYCCAGYVGNYYVYRFNAGTKPKQLDSLYTIREFSGTVFPTQTMHPIPFVVSQEGYQLRSSPIVFDSLDTDLSDMEEVEVRGNILARFQKGSRGLAVAKQADATGREWWFVVMDGEAKMIYTRFYSKQAASVCGWMSSRFLSRVE